MLKHPGLQAVLVQPLYSAPTFECLVQHNHVGEVYHIPEGSDQFRLGSVARQFGDTLSEPLIQQPTLFDEECKLKISPERYCELMRMYTVGEMPGTHSTWSKALDYAKRIGLLAHLDKGWYEPKTRTKRYIRVWDLGYDDTQHWPGWRKDGTWGKKDEE